MTGEPNPQRNSLGDYLRARRELVTPEQAGLPSFGLRRVPGLRREEVAMLAGISADYYLRLEQGRDRNPSVQVLESLARVLQLDDDGTAYLLSLGAEKPAPPPPPPAPGGDAGRGPRAAGFAHPARLRGGPLLRRAGRQPAGHRALAPAGGGPQPAAGRVPRPGRAGPLPGLGSGRGRPGGRVPRVGRHRHRRPPVHRAGRRAVAGQRPVPPALGPARRAVPRGRRGHPGPPAGRRAHPEPGEAHDRRHRRPVAGHLPRRARHQ